MKSSYHWNLINARYAEYYKQKDQVNFARDLLAGYVHIVFVGTQ